MERMVLVLVCLGLVGILVDCGYGYALTHDIAKRSTRQQGTMTEERAREIEEKAKTGHRAVINELNQRFAGYKENCFPMPKGCRCQVGNDVVRHMDENNCKNPITSTYRPGVGRPYTTTTARRG